MLSEEKHVFARRVALGSFLLDTFFQTLALLSDAESSRSSPSAIYVAYSPHPYAPLGLFVLGLSCQILWLLKFYPVPISGEQGDEEVGSMTLLSSSSGHEQSRTEEPTSQTTEELSNADVHEVSRAPQEVPMLSIPLQEEDNDLRASTTTQPTIFEVVLPEPAQSRYLPFYMLGSVFQASWSVMWMTRHYDYCSIVLYLNLATDLYVLFGILEGSKNQRYPQASLFTHLVVKIRIAVSVLCLWKTWGAVDIVPPPSPAESILNCLVFIILSLSSGLVMDKLGLISPG
ncbi:hypothetical protein D9613_001341 [Agrocybe pediades]|uniref:Uncharacterized protein n=1 Tax=Agrocybe pediades TaxID=84607 RepID=A0A8H4VUF7_9AGAR|nr:hypothetical protein D9613_001341 [Agrocybe pediades]